MSGIVVDYGNGVRVELQHGSIGNTPGESGPGEPPRKSWLTSQEKLRRMVYGR